MKNKIKSAFYLLAAFAICAVVCACPFLSFAQDSAATGGASGGFSLPSWVGIAAQIVLGVYELIIRYIPTVGNYSIVGWVIKIIQLLIPNNNSNTPSQPHP